MSITEEVVSRYDFWLGFVWDTQKVGLVCLAVIQAILLLLLGRAKRTVLSLLFAVASGALAWVLCATVFWLAFKVPNATYARLGDLGLWVLRGIPLASALITLGVTTVVFLKSTRGRLAV